MEWGLDYQSVRVQFLNSSSPFTCHSVSSQLNLLGLWWILLICAHPSAEEDVQHFEGKVHDDKWEPRLECPADSLQIICVCRRCQQGHWAVLGIWAPHAWVMQSITRILISVKPPGNKMKMQHKAGVSPFSICLSKRGCFTPARSSKLLMFIWLNYLKESYLKKPKQLLEHSLPHYFTSIFLRFSAGDQSSPPSEGLAEAFAVPCVKAGIACPSQLGMAYTWHCQTSPTGDIHRAAADGKSIFAPEHCQAVL